MRTILDLPSLKHISLVRISILLWKYHFSVQINGKKHNKVFDLWFNFAEEAVLKLADAFAIPNELKPMMSSLLSHIGEQVCDFVQFLTGEVTTRVTTPDEKFVKATKDVFEATEWTIHGQLNMPKTARALSQLKDWPVELRFEIAVVFCIADVVEDIWNENDVTKFIPFDKQKKPNFKCTMYKYWKWMTIKTDSSKISINKKVEMFFLSIDNKNQCAVEYFWSIMKLHERNALIQLLTQRKSKLEDLIEHCQTNRNMYGSVFASTFEIGIINFLLAEMDDEQMRLLLNSDYGLKFIEPLLIHFSSFKPTSTRILNLITSGDDFYDMIFRYQHDRWPDDLISFWVNAPAEMKRCYYDKKYSDLHPTLCLVQDVDNLHLLLNNASIKNRRRILSRCVSALFCGRTRKYKLDWDFMELVAKKYITTDYEMIAFKMHCSHLAYPICRNQTDKNKLAKIDRYFSFCFANTNEMRKLKKSILIDDLTRLTKKGSLCFDGFRKWLPATELGEISDEVASDLKESLYSLSFYFHSDVEKILSDFFNENAQNRMRTVLTSFYKLSEIIDSHEAGKLNRDSLEIITQKDFSPDNELVVYNEFRCCLAYRVCVDIVTGLDSSSMDKFIKFWVDNSHSYCIKCFPFYCLLASKDVPERLEMMLLSSGFSQEEVTDFMETYVDEK